MAQITLESIGDGVITTDIGGLVQYMNPVAERLTGWRNEAARGRRLEQVFHVIDDVTREPLQGLLEQCFHGAVDVEPANSAMLLRRGGEVACCGSCMDARGLADGQLVEGARRSSLDELTDWTLWADKVVTF